MLAKTKTPQTHSADLLGKSFARQMVEQGASSKDLILSANSILAEAIRLEQQIAAEQNKVNLQVLSKQT